MKRMFGWCLVAMMVATLGLAGCSGDDGKDADPAVTNALQQKVSDLTAQLTSLQDQLAQAKSDLATANDTTGADLQTKIDSLNDQLTATQTALTDAQAQLDDLQQNPAATTQSVNPEQCSVCHAGAGDQHQAQYERYIGPTQFEVTVGTPTRADNGDGTFDTTIPFTITKAGQPFTDLASLDQLRFMAVLYNPETNLFDAADVSFGDPAAVAGQSGTFTVTATGTDDLMNENAEFYMYIGQGEFGRAGAHITLYDDTYNVGQTFGTVNYDSVANVSGCEKCHGKPYAKHGYRAAAVPGLPDFAACKGCHFDTRGGTDFFQIMADNPELKVDLENRLEEAQVDNPGAELIDVMTDAEKAQYAYTANVMNDVHMSHAMEFPYPQSMANCATCHEGKLDRILTDANFTADTCKSCHVVTGPANEEYIEPGRAPALQTIWADKGVSWHTTDMVCNSCHTTGGSAKVFSAIHTGYNKVIYADNQGTKYSDLIKVTIDSATLSDDDKLDIKFSASGSAGTVDSANIVPTVMVGLYGYGTKDFIVGPHEKDADGNRLLQFTVDGTDVNPRITTVSATGGSWEVIADLSSWADMFANGTVKRAEIAVMPALDGPDGQVALNAPSRTFDLKANAFDDAFYAPIVNVKAGTEGTDGCNSCHDALATTFHSPDRGGNIVVCRLCHITKSGGSHLEMQSRSIDSYIHAIHSMQPIDGLGPRGLDYTDPVQALEYNDYIGFVYPTFTTTDCESCHNPGTYNIPSQAKSLPGILSGSDVASKDREIGNVPSYVTGPASRACGSCHRAQMINADDANGLAAFNQHTNANGYMVEDGDGVLDSIIEKIMSMFQ